MAQNPNVAILQRIGSSDDEYDSITLDSNLAEITVGRSRENYYSIFDSVISRKHAVFRFCKSTGDWTVESVGLHGIILNNVHVPKHQQMSLQHKDIVAFASVAKFLYSFQHAPQTVMIEEPLSKKLCLNQNSSVALQAAVCSTTSLERTVKKAKIDKQLGTKSEEAQDNKLHRQIMAIDFPEKTKELEERITRVNEENQVLIEQNKSIVHKSTMEIDIVQEQLETEKRRRIETMTELTNLKKSYKRLEKELKHKVNKSEDEVEKIPFQRQLRSSFMNGKSMISLSPHRLDKDGQILARSQRDSTATVARTRRSVPKYRVCFVYDEKMALHRNVQQPEHPEQPARITSVYRKLEKYGVLNRCHRLDSRIATREELLWLHTSDYIDELSATAKKRQLALNKLERQYDSIFFCPETYQAALLSAGSSLQVVESILSNQSRSGVAVIRPPGHHAERDDAFGFCYFNNTALAAKYAIEIHQLERILIVDWDIHHGNGIQKMFEEDPRVLYISLHRLDLFPFKPEQCDCNVVGTGLGAGFTVNIAWPSKGVGDSEYLAAFRRVVMPIATQYNPQLVLVAAGFDAALGDPLGGCNVTPEGYGQMCLMLTSLAEGRVALLLEGGYDLKSISNSMMMCANALLGDPLPTPAINSIQPGAAITIRRVVNYLLPYWSSLDVDVPSLENNNYT